MNPGKFSQMMKYLTRAKKANPDLPDVTFANKITQPPVRQDVETIEAINRFNRANPRTEKAGGGMLVQPGFGGTRQGYKDEKEYKRFKKTVTINGKKYGIITKKNDPNFGKYVYRGNKGSEYFDEVDDLKLRIEQGGKGRKFTGFSKGYLAELEDIKNFVNNKGAKNIFLSDLVEKFGDVTKETTDDSIRDATTEKKIKRAIGDDTYKKLIKGGTRTKIIAQKKKNANELVRAINRGDKPLISLSSDITGEAPNTFKSYLGKTERNMYDSIIPKLKAIVSRVTQPRQIYQATDAIEELKKATTKTFNQIIKKYPQAQAARNVLTSGKGIVAYNDKSYILSQLNRHIQNGGTKYRYVSGDTTATIKFRNTETGKLISLNNIDVKDPEFKEAADAYNQKKKIMNTEIDDPRIKGSKIKIGQAIAANGDSIVIDHLDDVKNNPLKNLVITNQKANMAATIKGATEAELKSIGRGLKLSTEDNIKRYSNYAKRVLISPDKKRPGPKETIFTKTGTLRGVTDPPDIEIKRLVATLGGGKCNTRGVLNQGGRVGLREGTPSVDVCYKNGLERIRKGGLDFTKAEAMNFNKLTKGLRAVGAKNIMKLGVIPEVLLEGALIVNQRVSEGDSFAQGLRNSYLAIPFQAMGVADTYEEARRKEILNPELINKDAAPLGEMQKKQVQDVFDMQDTFNERNKLVAQTQNLKNQIESTDAISDGPSGYVGDSQYIQKRLSDTRADLQDMYRGDAKGDVRRAEKLLTTKPMDLDIKDQLTMDAYNQAVEKANTLRAGNILVTPATGFGIDTYIKKKMKELPITPEYAEEQLQATGDYFGTGYTPLSLNRLFTSMGREDPRFGFDETGKYNEEKGLNDFMNYLKTERFAENFRDEKAGGGIAKIAGVSSGPAPVRGPNPQGLLSLKNRVRNY